MSILRLILTMTLMTNMIKAYDCDYNLKYKGLGCALDLSMINLYKKLKILLHNSSVKFAALTFDDGPSNTRINHLLSLLDNYHARATFFLVGEKVVENGEIVKEMVRKGHEIGNHSWSHKLMTRLTDTELAEDLKRTTEILQNQTNKPVDWFRPPFGCHNKAVIKVSNSLKMDSLLWTVDSEDYLGHEPLMVVYNVIANLHNGAVILLHDVDDEKYRTMEALPYIIALMSNFGYQFVTLSEWERRVCNAIETEKLLRNRIEL